MEIRIKNELPTDYQVVGTATSLKAYKFCYHLNLLLGCDFMKLKDLEFELGDRTRQSQFSVFKATANEGQTHYFVFANKQAGELLLPEAGNFDFLIQIFGKCSTEELQQLLRGIANFPEVLLTAQIPLRKIKNKERLVYREEKSTRPPLLKRFRE